MYFHEYGSFPVKDTWKYISGVHIGSCGWYLQQKWVLFTIVLSHIRACISSCSLPVMLAVLFFIKGKGNALVGFMPG